jgi:hypothetical protein
MAIFFDMRVPHGVSHSRPAGVEEGKGSWKLLARQACPTE